MRIRGTHNPVNWLLYDLSFVFPRRRNLWVFGTAEDGFFYNSIYFFQYVARKRTGIEAVWISGRDDLIWRLRNRGFRVGKRRCSEGYYVAESYFQLRITRIARTDSRSDAKNAKAAKGAGQQPVVHTEPQSTQRGGAATKEVGPRKTQETTKRGALNGNQQTLRFSLCVFWCFWWP